MKITIVLIILFILLIWAIPYDTLPKKYRRRMCAGKNWKRSFPNASKDEIRNFLIFFTDAFAFSPKDKLKFEPDDKVLDIYRELYPSKWMPDALEFETLAEDLEKEYGIHFSELWHEDLSLGEIFEKVKNA